MAEPLVHVLVINWNGREHLEECFETLLKSDYGNLRIVLIDNASDDGSVPFVREPFGVDTMPIPPLPERHLHRDPSSQCAPPLEDCHART